MKIPEIEQLDTPAKRSRLYIQKQFPEFYNSLPKVNKRFPEILYMYYYGDPPTCPVCGQPATFISFSKGYSKYCSSACANSDPTKKAKTEQTCLRRYGTRVSTQNEAVRQKIHNTCIERYGGNYQEIQKKCAHHDTGIEQFVAKILGKYHIKYSREDCTVIPPARVDFALPDYKIAIECNGIYWHSDKMKCPGYHRDRFVQCANAGWKLLTFWEDQIYRIPQIVESVLLSKLGIYKRRCGARQCTIKEIDSTTCNKFLDCNHIQGRTSSKIKLGAYINDELVGVMTFIQSRGCQGSKVKIDGQWELNRFCTLLNTQVIGLTSKMLKYFINQYHPTSIISFSHNDISVGNVYAKLGFHKEGHVGTSYYYIKSNRRYHRSNFTRAGIVRKWPEYDINDRSWTEKSVMDEKNYYRIYDCGTQKWTLNLTK